MIASNTTATQLVEDLLATFSDPHACIAELLCDRHPADAVAFTIVEPDRSVRKLTFGELQDSSRRFAVALADLGVEQGDRVATLMGKSAEFVIALVGIWRRGAVHVPLFTAFAPPAIAYRLDQSAAKLIVTDFSQRNKLDPGDDIPQAPPWTVIVAGGEPVGENHFTSLLAASDPHDPRGDAVAVGGAAEFGRLFTSGTTGNPKGVPIPVKAIASFLTYFRLGLGVRDDDVFWNAADPGWGFGLYYGIIAPLAAGHANILLHAGFSPELTYWVLSRLRVTNFAAAPTMYRVLRSSDLPVPTDLALQRCSAAGEPLNPEVISWSQDVLGVPVHDTYGQTEHGMCIVNGWHPDIARPLKPGSMGHPMPGWQTEVFLDERDEVAPPGTAGRVVIDVATARSCGSPST